MDFSNNNTSEIRRMRFETMIAGFLTGFGLIAYFISMRLLNLHTRIELHYFNIIILFLGLRYALKHIKLIKGELKYLEGLKTGLLVSLLSLIIFSVFMAVYGIFIDSSFFIFLQNEINIGHHNSIIETAFYVTGIIAIEGLSSGFILTFILMQYYKNDRSET